MKVFALMSRASLLRLPFLIAFLGAAALLPAATSQGQQQQLPKAEPAQSPGPAAPITALVEQLADLFPKVEGEVLEVQGDVVTLDLGRRNGIHPGLSLELYRAGREIRHPRTGQVLGRAEDSLGAVRVSEVQETFSQARASSPGEVKPGDRVRMSSAKVRITLLPLLGSVRETLVDAATNEIVERLSATGRFQVGMGDAINVYLSQEGLKAEDVLQGRGVKKVTERFKIEHLLAVHFQRVQGRPFMEVRFFSAPREDPAITMAFFVPPSIRSASQNAQFSSSRNMSNPPSAKPRSLLSRLLGGDLDPNTYSSGESTIPLREVARFPFPVLTMDVAAHPADKVPRLVVSDGERVYMYRISGEKLDAEWSISARAMGQVMAVQLVDLNGDGSFEVVGTRWHPDSGLNSFVLEFKNNKPRFLLDDIPLFLVAMDTAGVGYRQTLWAAPQHREVLQPRAGRSDGDEERAAGGRAPGGRARRVPTDRGHDVQHLGQGHAGAGLHRRLQPAAGLARRPGPLALVEPGRRRLHGRGADQPRIPGRSEQVLQVRAGARLRRPRRRRHRGDRGPAEHGPRGAARRDLQGAGGVSACSPSSRASRAR